MRRQPRHALNLGPGIRLRVPGVPVIVLLLFPLTKVDAAGQLTDYGEVDAAAYVLFERGDGGEGVGGEVAGAQVAEGGELFAELQEALFGADGSCAVFLGGGGGVSVLEGRGWERDGRSTGPPIAPRRTASADLAAARASSVRGEPVASMEAWERC